MPSTNPRSEIVLDLAEEFLDRYRRGERPALQEYVDRHPDLAADIREAFPAMAMLENIGLAEESIDRSPPGAEASGPATPTQLGDYRIIREVGRGGMGVVYEAEQVSLGRHVALKVLPRKLLLDGTQRRRFEREAKAAARLHHTNIVPVFGVGEQDGLPYYVMQFIRGLGLDAVLAEIKRLKAGETAPAPGNDLSGAAVAHLLVTGTFQPPSEPEASATGLREPNSVDDASGSDVSGSDTASQSSFTLPGAPSSGRKPSYWLSVAQIGIQVADALDYAHKQGVLHRDIKPSNLLLDLRGTVWVADFGLAKTDDQQDLTHTGDILGTLRFMPPEAFTGKADARGDIYALGLTLYELLAQRPAFGERDRNQLIKQVTDTEPTRLGKLNPAIPRDLQTIVHKAMEKDASHRYATARALAEDLQRFVDDRPIQARRVSTRERLWRWCRRNPAAAAASVLSVVACAAVVALVIGSGFALRLGQEQQRTEAARLLAEDLSARMVMARGLTLSEQGQVGRGLLWLAHSLKIAPEKATDLQQDIRANLAGWHRQIHPLKAVLPHRSQVMAVAFSPDGQTIVTGDIDGTARLWDVATGEPLPITVRHEKQIRGVAFSPDGKTIVTGSHDYTARLWEAATGKLLHPLPHPAEVMGVAFSPDGKLVATGCLDGKARLWDVATAKARELPTGLAAVWAVAFSPDGKTVVVAGNGGAEDVEYHLWDVATGKPCAMSPFQHLFIIWSVAFSPDGKTIVTGSMDKTARLWDVAADKPLGITLSHKAKVAGVAISPDGETIVTGSEDGVAQLWDRRTGQRRGAPLPHRDAVYAVAFSPDGKTLATGSHDSTVRLWEVGATKPLAILLPHPREVKVAAFSPDGRIVLTASFDRIQSAQLWDAVTGMPIGPPLRHDNSVECAAFSPDGKTVVLADGFSAQRWDVATSQPKGRRMIPPRGGRQPFGFAVAFSPDSRTILHGTWEMSAFLWDAATGKLVGEPLPHEDAVVAVAFSPDGKTFLTGSYDKTAKLWDAATRKLLYLLHHEGGVLTVAFSPDSRTVLTGCQDGTARLWDAATGQPLGTPLRHTGNVNRAVFSPDGKSILTGSSDGTARLWEAATRKPIGAPLAHQGAVRAVAFRPDGKAVVTGSDDGIAQLWDVATGKRLGTPLQHQDPVNAVAFSPDGQTILTASLDGNGRLWQPPIPIAGDVEQMLLWTQVITGMELDADGVIRVLDAPSWQQCRQGLESAGGPPIQLIPEPAAAKREQALRARQEEFDRAARAEVEKGERTARLQQRVRELTPRAREEGFLQDWLVLAPIPLAAGQSGADAVGREQIPDEANLRPRAGEPAPAPVGGQELIWKAHRVQGCFLDFNAFLGKETNDSVAYAVCYVVSPAERKSLKLLLGSDDQAKVYLNGREVFKYEEGRAALIDEDTAEGIALRQGVNVLVFKVVNGYGMWRGCLRFADQEGKPVTNIQVRLTPDP